MDEISRRYDERKRDFELIIPLGLEVMYEKLFQSWEAFNEKFFEGELNKPLIVLNDPEPDDEELGWVGDYQFNEGISYIRISTDLFHSLTDKDSPGFEEIKYMFIEDILIHEMIHQFIEETGEYDVTEQQYLGHGPKFAVACNRIGAKLNLPPVYVNKRPHCFAWPNSVQRLRHYLKPQIRVSIFERIMVPVLLKSFAFNGPDGGDYPDGGGTIVRLWSTAA